MLAVHHAGYEGIVRSEPAWRALSAAARSRRFVHAYDWSAAFFAHLRPPDEPIGLIELRREGRCVGLFPYQRRRIRKFGFTLTVLALPSSPHLILADVLLEDTGAARESLRALRAALARDRIGWHALLLANVLEDSDAVRFAAGLGGEAITRPGGGSRYFDATQPYAELSGHFAGPLRKTLKKGRKRLEQAGAVECVSIPAGDARMPWAFERFLALEAGGWKGETGTGSAIALSEDLKHFYRDLTAVSSAEMRVEINLLCLDGAPIAGQFASVCARRRSIHKIAYDESFQHASPGTVLMAHTLERSCADPAIDTLSLVTDMTWMRNWNARREAVYEVWIPRQAALGALARAALGAKQHLRARRRGPAEALAP